MSWKRDFYKVSDRRCIISSETRNASCNSRSFSIDFLRLREKEKKHKLILELLCIFVLIGSFYKFENERYICLYNGCCRFGFYLLYQRQKELPVYGCRRGGNGCYRRVVRRLRFGLLYNCGRRSYGLYRLRVVLPLFEGWRIGRITLVRPFLFVGR